MRAELKNSLIGLGGFAVGGLLLWLAVKQVDRQQLGQLIASFEVRYMLAACGIYWLGMVIRSSRWHCLLQELQAMTWWSVAEVLVVGYGANNLLPARLGEFARAEYAKRRFDLSRSLVLGTILSERLLDLIVVLGCLVGGLALGALASHSSFDSTIKGIVLNGMILVAVVGLAIKFLGVRLRTPGALAKWRIMREIYRGISSLNLRSASVVTGLSSVVWMCEAGSLWLTFKALHLSLSLAQTLLLVGASSLSTLLPTAPGYLGSYQLVFVLAMAAYGIPEAAGLVASLAVQIFMFGSVTMAALLFYFTRTYVTLKRQAQPSLRAPQERAAHG